MRLNASYPDTDNLAAIRFPAFATMPGLVLDAVQPFDVGTHRLDLVVDQVFGDADHGLAVRIVLAVGFAGAVATQSVGRVGGMLSAHHGVAGAWNAVAGRTVAAHAGRHAGI